MIEAKNAIVVKRTQISRTIMTALLELCLSDACASLREPAVQLQAVKQLASLFPDAILGKMSMHLHVHIFLLFSPSEVQLQDVEQFDERKEFWFPWSNKHEHVHLIDPNALEDSSQKI